MLMPKYDVDEIGRTTEIFKSLFWLGYNLQWFIVRYIGNCDLFLGY